MNWLIHYTSSLIILLMFYFLCVSMLISLKREPTLKANANSVSPIEAVNNHIIKIYFML